jgi:hypothetical protein
MTVKMLPTSGLINDRILGVFFPEAIVEVCGSLTLEVDFKALDGLTGDKCKGCSGGLVFRVRRGGSFCADCGRVTIPD